MKITDESIPYTRRRPALRIPHADSPPLGETVLAGFYGESGLLIKHATVLQGVESILLLLGLAAFALFALWRYLLWQQVRQ